MSERNYDLSPTKVRRDSLRGPRVGAILIVFVIVALFGSGVVWASRAELDQVTAGRGRIVPSSEVQVVQNLEGGIVTEIMVREGAAVEAGQVLLRIDDTTAAANFSEVRETIFGLRASIARLTAEVAGSEPEFSEDLVAEQPALVARERALFRSRADQLSAAVSILEQQKAQRESELTSLDTALRGLIRSYNLVREEYDLTKPLLEKGMVPKVDVLRLERQLADIQSQIDRTRGSIPTAKSGIAEAEQRIAERRTSFRSDAQGELNDRQIRLSALREQMAARADRVRRTEVRAPVKGTIKALNVNTLGQVVQPGDNLVEIVPAEDSLLVEARIRPSDVAFLHPGQAAKIKLTAYDFAIYGSLDGELEQISADTITDQQGNAFYEIRVRTGETRLIGKEGEELPIIPGMVAEVDILTGKRTVLQYLIKPIIRAQKNAFRER